MQQLRKGETVPPRRIAFTKGHGTENDFVLLEDRDGTFDPTPEQVRAICDRRAGIGADGILRVVPARLVPDAPRPEQDGVPGDDPGGDPGGEGGWFMDYRNADGSVSEMCGNGVRVFVRYLLDRSLVPGPDVPVGTRDGIKRATVLDDGRIRVAMGPTAVLGRDVTVQAAGAEAFAAAYRVDVGNPHAVTFVRADDLDDLDLHRAPHWEPADAFPQGTNVEFVAPRGERHIAMRVFERGSGETRSCGTGTCAAAAAAAEATRQPRPVTYLVDVPGGQVEVELAEDETYLTGPAVLVADGEFTLPV